jgi:hypothetical protein
MEKIDMLYKAAFLFVFALITVLVCGKAVTASRLAGIGTKFPLIFCGTMVAWYCLSLALSMNGFYRGPVTYSPNDLPGLSALVAVMIVPIVLFFLAYRANHSLRSMIDGVDAGVLIGLQAYRICGSYFLFLAYAKKAPLLFALPTGLFDFVIGLSALLLPLLLTKKAGIAAPLAKAWNYAGLLDFAMAFTIYFLFFPFRILKAPAPQVLIAGFFPISFIIIFPVPLAIILHALALIKLRRPIEPSQRTYAV